MPFSSYAICVDGNGCMPTLSDPPYPFNCLPKGLASTFERYQSFWPDFLRGKNRAKQSVRQPDIYPPWHANIDQGYKYWGQQICPATAGWHIELNPPLRDAAQKL